MQLVDLNETALFILSVHFVAVVISRTWFDCKTKPVIYPAQLTNLNDNYFIKEVTHVPCHLAWVGAHNMSRLNRETSFRGSKLGSSLPGTQVENISFGYRYLCVPTSSHIRHFTDSSEDFCVFPQSPDANSGIVAWTSTPLSV